MSEYTPHIPEVTGEVQKDPEIFHPHAHLELARREYSLGTYDEWSGKPLPNLIVYTNSVEDTKKAITTIIGSIREFPMQDDASISQDRIDHWIRSLNNQIVDPNAEWYSEDCPKLEIGFKNRLILAVGATSSQTLLVDFNKLGDMFNSSSVTTSPEEANQRKRIIYKNLLALQNPNIKIDPDAISLTLQTASPEEFVKYLTEIDTYYHTNFVKNRQDAATDELLQRFENNIILMNEGNKFDQERFNIVQELSSIVSDIAQTNRLLQNTILSSLTAEIHTVFPEYASAIFKTVPDALRFLSHIATTPEAIGNVENQKVGLFRSNKYTLLNPQTVGQTYINTLKNVYNQTDANTKNYLHRRIYDKYQKSPLATSGVINTKTFSYSPNLVSTQVANIKDQRISAEITFPRQGWYGNLFREVDLETGEPINELQKESSGKMYINIKVYPKDQNQNKTGLQAAIENTAASFIPSPLG